MERKQLDKGSIAQDFLEFQLRRNITNLFRNYLESLDGLKSQHEIMMEKLEKVLPKEQFALVQAADFFNEKQSSAIRKNILDVGNNSINDLLKVIERFELIAFNGNIKVLDKY
jgi:endonuclease III-like uncharacterized protein